MNPAVRRSLAALSGAALLVMAPSGRAGAQEHPAKRLASIVTVAVEEYKLAVDARGRLLSELEYGEAIAFLGDARGVAARLSGDRAAAAGALVDSILTAVRAKRPPAVVVALHERFGAALGAEGALDMPAGPPDLAMGRAIYERACASCHGALGRGDGPAGRAMNPAPPAIGDAAAMRDVSPALVYRIMSVGIGGTPMPAFETTLSSRERWNVVGHVMSLRATPEQVLEGEGLFLQRCAACHGAAGAGDGALSRALTRLPAELGAMRWQVEKSDAEIARVVRAGLPGTAMPPSADLTDAQVDRVVAYVRTLPLRSANGSVLASAASPSDTAARAAERVARLLDDALAAARAGRRDDAGDRAFDAYIAFEPLETPARAKNPGLVASMERHFAEFKGAVRAGDARAAERSRNAIEAGMPSVLELTRPAGGRWGTFFQSFLIVLREGLEAILVIGAIVAFLLKTGHRERLRSIWWGVGLGLAASAVTAVVLQTALRALPATREIIEGATLLVAVAVLFSVSYWLISKVEAARWQRFIQEKVTSALSHGGGKALAFVAFLAVYREGAETALFYQALFNEAHAGVPILLGIVAGGAVLAVVFTLFYRFGVRIPLRQFFAVTSVLLYYMAFVFAGKGVRELQEGNAAPITVLPGFPHVEALGIYPTLETLGAQLLLLMLFVFALARTFWPKRSVALPTVPAGAAPPVEAKQLAELRDATARLQARIAALEDSLSAESQRDA